MKLYAAYDSCLAHYLRLCHGDGPIKSETAVLGCHPTNTLGYCAVRSPVGATRVHVRCLYARVRGVPMREVLSKARRCIFVSTHISKARPSHNYNICYNLHTFTPFLY